MQQELERNRAADHLGQIAGNNRHLAEEPERDRRGLFVVVAAGLGEVFAGH
jgi:hypothetical protein